MDKDTILAEIRRTAAENGGKALGIQRFETVTGIKPGDWEGRYWARWGDAIREAGLTPAKWIEPHDKTALLSALASFARELGRVPTRREMELRRKSAPEFPGHNAFRNHFGEHAEQVVRLQEYCEATPGFEDVAAICAATKTKPTVFPATDKPAVDVIGFVYLLKSGGYYKLGRTNAIGRRERELAIQLPEKATTIHSIETDDPVGIEAYWHRRFEPLRKNGEWFDLGAAEVRAFKRRRFM